LIEYLYEKYIWICKMIEQLKNYQREFLKKANEDYKRYIFKEINFKNKLIGITGARGVGKSTILLQHLKESSLSYSQKLYVSVDVIGVNSLLEIALQFSKEGGKLLIFDEIHKYPNFEQELKNIYDMLDLQVIFSGSSALKLDHAKADLSRRVMMYEMEGLSFREFLEIKNSISLPILDLEDILSRHIDLAYELSMKFNLYHEWREYLKYGYYPFYFENQDDYLVKLTQTINIVIESDIPSIFPMDYSNVVLLKKLVNSLIKNLFFPIKRLILLILTEKK